MSTVHPFRPRGRDSESHPAGPALELDAESIAAGYALLFDPVMRAAQIACLGLAQLTRDDGWPDPAMVRDFARLYGVPATELGAFFGWLYVAPDRATPAMQRAFGFLGLATDVIATESRAAGA